MSGVDVRETYAQGEVMGRTLSPKKYAAARGLRFRDVQDWVKNGYIPGAVQNPRNGFWSIPEHAPVLDAPQPGWVVPERAAAGSGTVAVRQATSEVAPPMSDVRLADRLDTLPAYVDVPTAARLLGITPHAVRSNAVELEGRKWGEGGAWVIPQAVIRRRAGISPT
jgi:hypothetical protein